MSALNTARAPRAVAQAGRRKAAGAQAESAAEDEGSHRCIDSARSVFCSRSSSTEERSKDSVWSSSLFEEESCWQLRSSVSLAERSRPSSSCSALTELCSCTRVRESSLSSSASSCRSRHERHRKRIASTKNSGKRGTNRCSVRKVRPSLLCCRARCCAAGLRSRMSAAAAAASAAWSTRFPTEKNHCTQRTPETAPL